MTKHQQASLFDDAPANSISVVQALGQQKPADKQQATFQRLLRQVDEQRKLLTDWKTYASHYSQRVSGELLPLHEEYTEARRTIVRLLDTYCDKHILKGKMLQTQLKSFLVETLETLLEEKEDDEMDALYKKYRNISFSEQKAAALKEKMALIHQLFGIPTDELDSNVNNLDELVIQLQKNHFSQWIGDDAEPLFTEQKRQTAKQKAAERKKEDAAKNISQTVRSVYRKLASALHPDRETDASAREKKNEQMQRVNQAYEAGDLLALLNLQFEIEQIDAKHFASLSAERLKHYIEVLREQLTELKAALDDVITPFRPLCPGQLKLVPTQVDRAMNAEIVRSQTAIRNIKKDLARLQNPAELKGFIEEIYANEGFDEEAMRKTLIDQIEKYNPDAKSRKKKAAKR